MPRKPKRKSKAHVLGLLLLLSVVAAILPPALTAPLGSVLQILVPIQDGLKSVAPVPRGGAIELSGPEAESLYRTLKSKDHQIAALYMRIEELRQVNEALSEVRHRGLEDGRLIAARFVSVDSLPWRDTRLLDHGTLAGVALGDAVVSDHWLSLGTRQGAAGGMSVLSGEVLIGEIEQAYTHTARVTLLTDVRARTRLVRIGRQESRGFETLPAEFLLGGLGENRMMVRDVAHTFIENQQIRVGDTVVTSGSDARLPCSMVVGQVAEIRRDDDNGVLYHLVVEPALDLDDVRNVFVVDISGE